MKMDADQATPFSQAWVKGTERGQQIQQQYQTLLGLLQGIFRIIAWVISIPIEVFLHHSFGVRYLNPVSIFLGMIVLFIGLIATGSLDGEVSLAGALILLLYTMLALGHALWAYRQERRGVRWHSRSAGIPWGFWKFLPVGDPGNIVRVYEPVLVGLLGLALTASDDRYGIFLIVMAMTVWARRWVESWELRSRVLDQIDEQIEAEMMADLVQEKRSPWDTHGYVIPQVAIAAAKSMNSVSVEEAVTNLDMTIAEIEPGVEGEQPGDPVPPAQQIEP